MPIVQDGWITVELGGRSVQLRRIRKVWPGDDSWFGTNLRRAVHILRGRPELPTGDGMAGQVKAGDAAEVVGPSGWRYTLHGDGRLNVRDETGWDVGDHDADTLRVPFSDVAQLAGLLASRPPEGVPAVYLAESVPE